VGLAEPLRPESEAEKNDRKLAYYKMQKKAEDTHKNEFERLIHQREFEKAKLAAAQERQ
jgi:hypothetical protein